MAANIGAREGWRRRGGMAVVYRHKSDNTATRLAGMPKTQAAVIFSLSHDNK